METYQWILLYWMPYDNDLTRYERPINYMLRQGVQSQAILAIVQSDRPQAEHMTRHIL